MEPTYDKELFLRISTYLTGFDEAELYGTGMLDTYYGVVSHKSTPNDLRYFLDTVADILKTNNNNEAAIDRAIATYLMPASAYNGLAQEIINLWYTGNWPIINGDPVSAQAYIQGLVWDAAQTHPPGAKQPGFGSWSLPPL